MVLLHSFHLVPYAKFRGILAAPFIFTVFPKKYNWCYESIKKHTHRDQRVTAFFKPL